MLRRLTRVALWLVLGPAVLLVVHLIVFRFVPVPLTPLMVIRAVQGEGFSKDWVSLREISPHVARAVIASEDNRFCEHGGIDWTAVRTVMEEYRDDGRLRGASTISMQTAKNLYFWPGRSVLRKGLEVVTVQLLEAAWPKERIVEVYLNIAEMGPGVYGVEAAALHHWGISAHELNTKQSAALASILPAPRRRDPTLRNRAIGQRVSRIEQSLAELGPMLGCVPSPKTRRRARRDVPTNSRPSGSSARVDRPEALPVHLEPKKAESKHKSAPDKPRRSKRKKVRSKRRRRTR